MNRELKLDGLRGLAIISVLLFHLYPNYFQSGYIGVDIFLVLSGYLTFKTIIVYKNKNLSIIYYIKNRVLRLFPSLIFIYILIISIGFVVFDNAEFKELNNYIIYNQIGIANYIYAQINNYFNSASKSNILLHFWSLSLEWQFYLFASFALFSIDFNKNIFRYLLALLIIFSFSINLYYIFHNNNLAFYSIQSRMWEFLLPVFLINFNLYKREKIHYLTFVICSLIASFIICRDSTNFPGLKAIIIALPIALIVTNQERNLLNKIFENRILIFFGSISYALYVVHWPVFFYIKNFIGISILDKFTALFISVFISFLITILIENPIKKSSINRKNKLITIFIITYIAIFALSYNLKSFSNENKLKSILNDGEVGEELFFNHFNNYIECKNEKILSDSPEWNGRKRCFQSKYGDVDIAVVGDSHAEHLFFGVSNKYPQHNTAIYYKSGTTATGLPFIDNINFKDIYSSISEQKSIKTVIISIYWNQRIDGYLQDDLKNKFQRTIDFLNFKGKEVIIFNGVPDYYFDPNICKYEYKYFVNNNCSIGLEYFDKRHKKTANLLESLHGTALRVVDSYHIFCNYKNCNMNYDGQLMYRDGHHLNFTGSNKLIELLNLNL
jgi:peptidoglycan/LPS O-acetylase OafA/YrhL